MDWAELRSRWLPASQSQVLPPRIKLPILSRVVLEFSRVADDPDASAQRLGTLIETDATLTCELLKYVNSPAFAGRNKVSTAQQAISRLGIKKSRSFLLSAAAQQTMKASKSKLINIQSLWLTNLERALFAAGVARCLKADADLAYSASLLQDFLLPVLSNELFDLYLNYLQTRELQTESLVEYERRHLGWDHAQATAQVLHAWGFPDDLVCCVRMQHAGLAILQDAELGNSPIAAVAVAALIPDPLRQSPVGLEQLVGLDGIWPKLKLPELAQDVRQQLHESTNLAGQHTTLAQRLEALQVAAVR